MRKRGAKNYVITSAQACANPHPNFLKGLEKYCDVNDASLIILPMIGQNAKEDMDRLKPIFQDKERFKIVEGMKYLNSNIKIEQFNIRPYQIDPLVGLNRFAQRETTIVLASPKQRLRPIAHSNHK